jgi:spermidine/putrescine transport system ATP-binding protein
MMSQTPARDAVQVDGVSKVYGGGQTAVTALDDVSLEIQDNEFFTLLGPSGCGKTTLLRCIAGFEQLSSGRLLLFEEEIEDLPPNKRPINTVFQHYALFPHMTVRSNVAFGLRMLKRSEKDVSDVVGKMLELVHMTHLADRRPTQLSGGQQQRVALARALASHPKVLLLDEPLSALDLKLRQAMRVELKQLQEETGITFIFVTHDQEEALTMSDRIAVMSEGKVQQIGPPLEVYERPINHFVADFIGETNFIDVSVESVDGETAVCATSNGEKIVSQAVGGCKAGDKVSLSIRPEKIELRAAEDAGNGLRGRIDRPIYLGTDTHYQVALDGEDSTFLVRIQNAHDARVFEPAQAIGLVIDPQSARMLVD